MKEILGKLAVALAAGFVIVLAAAAVYPLGCKLGIKVGALLLIAHIVRVFFIFIKRGDNILGHSSFYVLRS